MQAVATEQIACPVREPLTVEVLKEVGAQRQQCERDLLASGVTLPLPHRCAWALVNPSAQSWFIAVRDSQRKCRGGFAVEVRRSRLLPGHLLLLAERVGGPASDLALDRLIDLVRRDRRVLRLHVQLFGCDRDERARNADLLRMRGFWPIQGEPLFYLDTLRVDLTAREEAIWASFHKSARRNIKEIGKRPVELRPLREVALVPRMEHLLREAMGRTGGKYVGCNWEKRIELAQTNPELARLVGLFRTDVSGPEALVSFAWGCHHGESAQYCSAASARLSGLNISLAHALIWDLMCWAKRHGARWFDLGGITEGHLGSADRLGGISDFKRLFSKDVVSVGEEWLYEPRPVRAKMANVLGRGIACAARLVHGVARMWERPV